MEYKTALDYIAEHSQDYFDIIEDTGTTKYFRQHYTYLLPNNQVLQELNDAFDMDPEAVITAIRGLIIPYKLDTPQKFTTLARKTDGVTFLNKTRHPLTSGNPPVVGAYKLSPAYTCPDFSVWNIDEFAETSQNLSPVDEIPDVELKEDTSQNNRVYDKIMHSIAKYGLDGNVKKYGWYLLNGFISGVPEDFPVDRVVHSAERVNFSIMLGLLHFYPELFYFSDDHKTVDSLLEQVALKKSAPVNKKLGQRRVVDFIKTSYNGEKYGRVVYVAHEMAFYIFNKFYKNERDVKRFYKQIIREFNSFEWFNGMLKISDCSIATGGHFMACEFSNAFRSDTREQRGQSIQNFLTTSFLFYRTMLSYNIKQYNELQETQPNFQIESDDTSSLIHLYIFKLLDSQILM